LAEHKQALKRHRQSLKRRTQNRIVRGNIRALVKQQNEAIEKNDVKKAQEILKNTVIALDRAASKGVIPKKRASRKISRLSAKVYQLSTAPKKEKAVKPKKSSKKKIKRKKAKKKS